jgi:hypothetical protein
MLSVTDAGGRAVQAPTPAPATLTIAR